MVYSGTTNRRTGTSGTSLSRRGFLKTAGMGAACLAAAPYVSTGQQRGASETTESILGQAEARIQKYRKGRATLRLVGPDGQALPPGLSLQIDQTRHKFFCLAATSSSSVGVGPPRTMQPMRDSLPSC
jgi:hypothetical protein